MIDTKTPDPLREQQQQALERAKALAEAGDPTGMMKALAESLVMDRLADRLQRRWRSVALHPDQAQYFVGEAVDALYTAIRKGQKILNVGAFIFKVADRKAYDHHQDRRRERPVDPERLGQTLRDHRNTDPDNHPQGNSILSPEERRRRALAIARAKLPQLGQHNVQAVMTYVLDAIEQEREDVPYREIADALGLTIDTAKKSLGRGLQRLARIAREEGLASQDFIIPQFMGEDKEDTGEANPDE